MKTVFKGVLLFTLCSLPVISMAEKVAVIVNATNAQALTKADVAAIYSDNMIQWGNGVAIKSYDLPISHPAREAFSRHVLGMSADDVAKEWANRKITNTAKNPPLIKNERLVVLSVRRNANAIGYVSAAAAQGKDGIRAILTLDY